MDKVKSKALKVVEDTKAYAKEKTSQALDMSNAAKQRVVTMAQQRMLAVAASKEAMRSYLQHGQVLLLDAYKEFRASGVKEFSQKYAALLKQHTGEHALLLKQLAIKQSQQVKASSLAAVGSVQSRVTTTYATCHAKAEQAVASAKAKTLEISSKAKNVAKDGHVQATAAGVCGGAAALGATGGATGLTAGAVVGAALGVVPAIFTFGLSIPLGAAIGGESIYSGNLGLSYVAKRHRPGCWHHRGRHRRRGQRRRGGLWRLCPEGRDQRDANAGRVQGLIRCGSGSRKGRGLRGLCEEPGHLGPGQVRQGRLRALGGREGPEIHQRSVWMMWMWM